MELKYLRFKHRFASQQKYKISKEIWQMVTWLENVFIENLMFKL